MGSPTCRSCGAQVATGLYCDKCAAGRRVGQAGRGCLETLALIVLIAAAIKYLLSVT